MDIKLLLVLMLFVFGLVGCSANETVKYGKLHAMQDMLTEATKDCEDDDRRKRAVNWAVEGIRDLNGSKRYLERDSEEYQEVKRLISHLSLVGSRRNKETETLCNNISQASKATDEFFVRVEEE